MPSKGLAAWCALAAITSCTGCHQPSAENGAALFRKNCIACHSLLPGHAQHGPSLRGYFERSPRPTIAQARSAILGGGPFMPPFRGRLSSGDVDDLIVYMRALR
jgi:mono/diheme cytochrome c family protein